VKWPWSKPVPAEVLSTALTDGKRNARQERVLRRVELLAEDELETHKAFKEMARDLALRKAESEERLQMVTELRSAERWCRTPEAVCSAVAESYINDSPALKEAGVTVDQVFKERLWELELALEDRGWVRETTLAALEFSRYGVQQLIRICRIYGIKNPIIKRISEICELYVFGRGIEIRSEDDTANDVIQDFLQDNDAEMGHNGLAAKEKSIQTDGALYFSLPTDNKGNVRVIMVDPLEIVDVATDPDDTSQSWFFKRQWHRTELDVASGQQVTVTKLCWYPSLELVMSDPKEKPVTIGGLPVNWDQPILRDTAGGSPSKWRWPVPPVYAAIDWARAYKDALEDYATVRRTLARFALMVETKGGPGAIAAYNALFSTSFADGDGTQIERNPPPVVGSVHTSGPGTKMEAFKSAGAQGNPEELRRLLLMSCASAGMPETFFGDASTGSLATAVSLDRPTELKFVAIQRRWRHTIKRILEYVLRVSSKTIGGKMREARNGNPAPQPVKIIVKFPNVIEHLIQPMIQAITEIATCGGRNGISAGIVDRRTIASLLLTEIGYEHVDVLLDKIYGKGYKPANDVTDQRSQVPPQSLVQPTGTPLDDLSDPPPLPPLPAPPPPVAALPPAPGAGVPAVPAKVAPASKPSPAGAPSSVKPAGAKPTKKEALTSALEALRAVVSQD
jgi:hypothetical protein